MVHVQHVEEREFYSLERLWKDCPVIELPEEINADAKTSLTERWGITEDTSAQDEA